jgi:hypothetical protein
MSRLRSAAVERLRLARIGLNLKGLAILGGWLVFLLWVNFLGYGGGFEYRRGFPVPYEVLTDYEWFTPHEYPEAIPVDIGFAVCSIALIATLIHLIPVLVRGRTARPK